MWQKEVTTMKRNTTVQLRGADGEYMDITGKRGCPTVLVLYGGGRYELIRLTLREAVTNPNLAYYLALEQEYYAEEV